MPTPAGRFPADHFVESLRGRRHPARELLVKRLANRAAWLERKIAARRATGEPFAYFVEELAAIVLAIDNLPSDPAGAPPVTWRTTDDDDVGGSGNPTLN